MKAKEIRNLGYSFRSGLEAGLQMNFGKEKDMKETNLEHYKKELKEIYTFNYDNPRGVIKKIEERFGCQIKLKSGEHPTDAILEWMAQPFNEPILDEAERKYLSEVIRPFRNKVEDICKSRTSVDGTVMYSIQISLPFHIIALPIFPTNSHMYKGMFPQKEYSLKELGL